ncbi:glycosyl transferase family 2, partial [Desulfobacteraceae bacterium SEEP-SAG9]
KKSEKGDKKQRKSSLLILRSIMHSLVSGFIFRPFMFFILPGLALMLPSIYTLTLIIKYTLFYFQDLDPSTNYRFGISLAKAFELSPHSFIVGGISLIVTIQLFSLGILSLQQKRYYEELFHLSTNIYRSSLNDNRK